MGHGGEIRRACPDGDRSGVESYRRAAEQDGRIEEGTTEDQGRKM